MYNKNNLAVAKVASKSSIRPSLACVAFYGDKTVATDSFRLIEMSADGEGLETPELYHADVVKGIKLKKGETIDSIPGEQGANGDTFPLYEHVIADAEKHAYRDIMVNAEYLAEICTILKDVHPFKKIKLSIPVAGTQYPVIITAQGARETDQKARALLMPFNS